MTDWKGDRWWCLGQSFKAYLEELLVGMDSAEIAEIGDKSL
jgi:hypothetical protein